MSMIREMYECTTNLHQYANDMLAVCVSNVDLAIVRMPKGSPTYAPGNIIIIYGLYYMFSRYTYSLGD